jgi:hypothetical protein
LVTLAVKETVPDAPAVKVIELVVAPAVTVALVTVHWYVAPFWAGTLATSPIWLAVTALGAVTVATGAA